MNGPEKEHPKPKTDEEWLAETANSLYLTKAKLSILGQIALSKLAEGQAETTT